VVDRETSPVFGGKKWHPATSSVCPPGRSGHLLDNRPLAFGLHDEAPVARYSLRGTVVRGRRAAASKL